MKGFSVILALLVVGCASSPDSTKVATWLSVEDGIHLRTPIADIEMKFADVEDAFRKRGIKIEDRERYLALLGGKKSQRIFIESRQDEVAGLIANFAAPVLLAEGRCVIVDLRSQKKVEFILSGYSRRGAIGPLFCFPDGTEFFRHVVMTE